MTGRVEKVAQKRDFFLSTAISKIVSHFLQPNKSLESWSSSPRLITRTPEPTP
jgi:hypothetical protein